MYNKYPFCQNHNDKNCNKQLILMCEELDKVCNDIDNLTLQSLCARRDIVGESIICKYCEQLNKNDDDKI